MAGEEVKSTILTIASYWILGLCNNFGYVVMLSSAHDILKSNSPVVPGGNEVRIIFYKNINELNKSKRKKK